MNDELVENLRRDHHAAEKWLQSVEEKHRPICEELERAKATVEALAEAIRNATGEQSAAVEASTGPTEPSRNGWANMSRAEAIRAILAARGPMYPSAISRALSEVGRTEDPPNLVSAGLAAMAKRGKVHKAGKRGWALVKEEGGSG